MKALLPLLACTATLSAQQLVPAYVIDDGDGQRAWIEAASETSITYRRDAKSLNRIQARTVSTEVFFFQPPEFKRALNLFKNRDYTAARTAFAEAKTKYKMVDDISGNYSTLAGFYELECARKLGDYEGLEKLLEKFQPAPLVREYQKTQLKIYPLYNALRNESWDRLKILCDEYTDRNLPGALRAQIEYCLGKALQGLNQPFEALIAFNKSCIADYTASEIITKNAALASLKIYSELPEVILAKKLHGTPEENPNSTGALLLTEAAGLVTMWDKALGNGTALPDEYKAFAKYKKEGA
ncbi:MAG: hypothetical protein AAGC74_02495 [Verrucomicrobiota bacterium]